MCVNFDQGENRTTRAGRDGSNKPPRIRRKTKSKGARRLLPASASPLGRMGRSRSPRLIDAFENCRIRRYNSFTKLKSFDSGGSQSEDQEDGNRRWRPSSDLDADALLFRSKNDCEGDGCEGDGCEGDGCEEQGERRVSEDVTRDADESTAEDVGGGAFERTGYSHLDPLRDAMRSRQCDAFEALASMTPPRR